MRVIKKRWSGAFQGRDIVEEGERKNEQRDQQREHEVFREIEVEGGED